MKTIKIITPFILAFFVISYTCGQNPKKDILIGFYNLENLFDTINNENVNDGEFTPEGKKYWNSEKYQNKLEKLSQAISDIGITDGFENGPDVLGVCEVENKGVLIDLVNQDKLKSEKYEIVHYNSPDKRGIDVALLYNKNKFKFLSSKPYQLYITNPINGNRIYTRNQLLVTGEIKNQKIHFIVNHWPSRWGGELQSQPLRLAAAQLCRHITDSLLKADSLANIIIMGDFNDDPTNLSMEKYLNTAFYSDSLMKNQLFNSSAELFLNGTGSLCYRGKWNMFDQLVVSPALLDASVNDFTFFKTQVVQEEYLFQKEGKYKGYPLRTHGGNTYLNGYSDHLPVYLILSK